MNNETITKLVVALLGKQAAYRLGRALYQKARGDIANSMATNGELMIQRCVLDAWRNSLIPNTKLVVFDVGANIGDWSYEFLDNSYTDALGWFPTKRASFDCFNTIHVDIE